MGTPRVEPDSQALLDSTSSNLTIKAIFTFEFDRDRHFEVLAGKSFQIIPPIRRYCRSGAIAHPMHRIAQWSVVRPPRTCLDGEGPLAANTPPFRFPVAQTRQAAHLNRRVFQEFHRPSWR